MVSEGDKVRWGKALFPLNQRFGNVYDTSTSPVSQALE